MTYFKTNRFFIDGPGMYNVCKHISVVRYEKGPSMMIDSHRRLSFRFTKANQTNLKLLAESQCRLLMNTENNIENCASLLMALKSIEYPDKNNHTITIQ